MMQIDIAGTTVRFCQDDSVPPGEVWAVDASGVVVGKLVPATPSPPPLPAPAPPLLAYRVEVRGWPESVGIYAALSAGKARYASWLNARDAGYQVGLTELLVRRSPEWDEIMANEKPGKGWTLEHMEYLKGKRKRQSCQT